MPGPGWGPRGGGQASHPGGGGGCKERKKKVPSDTICDLIPSFRLERETERARVRTRNPRCTPHPHTHTAHPHTTMSRSWDTFPGLLAVLDSPAWPVDQSCAAVERCLLVNRDAGGRAFFEACFPALLRNVFGLEGPSWLGVAARVRREGAVVGERGRGAKQKMGGGLRVCAQRRRGQC